MSSSSLSGMAADDTRSEFLALQILAGDVYSFASNCQRGAFFLRRTQLTTTTNPLSST